jgi:chromate transporter
MNTTSLGELARLFLKLGTIAFGGPAAHIAMMEDEVVRRRGWLTREQFLDYLGATNLIPGPNSTELAIHIGAARAGWRGLLVAGACFILPAALMVGVIAWAYVRYGALPEVAGLLYGVKPVVIAIVAGALWSLGHTAIKSRTHAVVAVAAVAAAAAGVNELAVLAGAGALMLALHLARSRGAGAGDVSRFVAPLVTSQATASGTGASAGGMDSLAAGGLAAAGAVGAGGVAAASPVSLPLLFGVFVKIGATLFGSGYVLIAYMRADLVARLGWLSERQLLDAVAVGQTTPGPVFTTATFVGYLVGDSAGAAIATVGIFLPAFLFVALSGLLVPRIRHSRAAGAFLDGVVVASLALMAVVLTQLWRDAVVDALTVALVAVAALLLLRFRVNTAWLVLGGGLVGLLATP